MVIEAPPFLNDDMAGPLPWHAAELQGRIDTLSNESRFDALHGGATLGTRSGQGLQIEEGLREGAGGADTWSEGEGIAAKPSLWQDDFDALSAVAKVSALSFQICFCWNHVGSCIWFVPTTYESSIRAPFCIPQGKSRGRYVLLHFVSKSK
jgi:hypothetical protein